MKKNIYSLLLRPAAVLLAWGTALLPAQAQQSIVKGKLDGIGNEPIQFWYTQKGKQHSDKVYPKNDRFEYKAPPSDDGTMILYVKRPRYFTFWQEPGTIEISGTAADPSRLRVKGGKENALTDEYNTTIEWPYADKAAGAPDSLRKRLGHEETQKTLAFIQAHPDSRHAANLLYWQLVGDETKVAAYDSIWNRFTPEVRSSPQGISLNAKLHAVRNQPMPGKQAPDFTIADTTGKAVSLQAFKGKYVLLDFWGHWCGPCVKAVPQLKSINDRLAGRLAIIGIAAEDPNDRDEWLNMIRNKAMNWTHLSEFQVGNGPTNVVYNIVQFPTYFLLDPNGKVIAKTSAFEGVEAAIAAIPELK